MSGFSAAIGRLGVGVFQPPPHALTASRRVPRARAACVVAACCMSVGACGGTQSSRVAGATAAEVPPPGAHDLTCEYVGLESTQGMSDVNADTVSLLAVFRFSESDVPPPKQPLSLKFQVERSRVNELQDGLSARPQVICRPHGQDGYAPDVTPMPGVHGEPQAGAPQPPAEAPPHQAEAPP